MSEVLYRKYRPSDFDQILGQEPIKKTLLSAIQNDSVSHAYLFAGPRGTGKTTVARLFARKVNNIESENSTNQLDIIEIDAASNRGIEEIRDLREKVNFAPSSLRYKVYIIDEVHMLTKEAFNALLKTLEEPPAHVIFILATTEIHKVPITVLSRTQRFDFKLAPAEEISKKINYILESEGKKMDSDGIQLIAGLGKGSFRDTETILEKVINSVPKGNKKISLDEIRESLGLTSDELINNFVKALITNDSLEAFTMVRELEKNGVNINYFYYQVLENLRRILISIQTKENTHNISTKRLAFIISSLIEASIQMKFSPIEILTLEVALAKIFDETPVVSQSINSTVHKKDTIVTKKPVQQIAPEPKKEESSVEIAYSDEPPTFTIEDIRSVWPVVLEKIKPYNHHLLAFLKKVELGKLDGNELTLKVGYKFHKQRIEQKASQKALAEVFRDIFKYPGIIVKCEVDENIRTGELDEPGVDSNEDLVEEIFGP